MRVGIDRNNTLPDDPAYFSVPGLMPLIKITVQTDRDEWDAFPPDYPLIDTIRQSILDRCGLNVTLVLAPSELKLARYSARFGIPISADWNDVKRALAVEQGVISPVTREVLLAITTIYIFPMADPSQLKNALALMPNITCAVVFTDDRNILDFGLDTLPNLRNIEIKSSAFTRDFLRGISKLRHLERLRLADVGDEVDWDALCDMFTTLPRLLVLSVDCDESMKIIDTIRSSKNLRRAMENIAHFVVIGILASDSLVVIEALSLLENIKNITVCLRENQGCEKHFVATHIAAAHAKARELRSSSIRIDIIEISARLPFLSDVF
jgi:hypothetical protein